MGKNVGRWMLATALAGGCFSEPDPTSPGEGDQGTSTGEPEMPTTGGAGTTSSASLSTQGSGSGSSGSGEAGSESGEGQTTEDGGPSVLFNLHDECTSASWSYDVDGGEPEDLGCNAGNASDGGSARTESSLTLSTGEEKADAIVISSGRGTMAGTFADLPTLGSPVVCFRATIGCPADRPAAQACGGDIVISRRVLDAHDPLSIESIEEGAVVDVAVELAAGPSLDLVVEHRSSAVGSGQEVGAIAEAYGFPGPCQ